MAAVKPHLPLWLITRTDPGVVPGNRLTPVPPPTPEPLKRFALGTQDGRFIVTQDDDKIGVQRG